MKSYCTQNNGKCSTCSLVNYGRDCQNNPINDDYIRIRIPGKLKQEFLDYCEAEDKNMSAVVRRLIEQYLVENLKEIMDEKEIAEKFCTFEWDPDDDKTNWLVTYNGEQYIVTFYEGSWIFDKLIERDNNVIEREPIWEIQGTKEHVPRVEVEEYLIEYC